MKINNNDDFRTMTLNVKTKMVVNAKFPKYNEILEIIDIISYAG